MIVVRRWAGPGTLVLATLGLLLCIAGIVVAWVGKSRADAVSAAIFESADEAFGFVDFKLDRVKQVLKESRHRVGDMSRIAARLQSTEANARKECEPLLQTLEDVCREMKTAESWLDSSRALASGVSRISEAVVSSEYAAAHQESAGVAAARDVQAFANSVTDALTKLQTLRLELAELRDRGKVVRKAALGIIAHVADLDGRLASLCDRVEKLDAKLSATRESCAELNHNFCRRTLVAAVLVTVVLVWLGFSQIVTMGYGWRLAHVSVNSLPSS
jgi:hypothetical protein